MNLQQTLDRVARAYELRSNTLVSKAFGVWQYVAIDLAGQVQEYYEETVANIDVAKDLRKYSDIVMVNLEAVTKEKKTLTKDLEGTKFDLASCKRQCDQLRVDLKKVTKCRDEIEASRKQLYAELKALRRYNAAERGAKTKLRKQLAKLKEGQHAGNRT